MFFQKANPYHDPKTGRFTHAPSGPRVGTRINAPSGGAYRSAKGSLVKSDGTLDEAFAVEVADALLAERAREAANGPAYPTGTTFDRNLMVARQVQGFDGLPTVLPDAEFDALTAPQDVRALGSLQNKQMLYRGDKDPAHVAEMRTGRFFPGTGIGMNGTYTAIDIKTAEQYATQNGIKIGPIQRIKLHSASRRKMIDREASTHEKEVLAINGLLRDAESRGVLTGAQSLAISGAIMDAGVLATLEGFDYVQARSREYVDLPVVVLNRTSMIFSESTL